MLHAKNAYIGSVLFAKFNKIEKQKKNNFFCQTKH
jgi:hypothetical protein